MVGTVIVIRPCASIPTRLSFNYAGELIEYLNESGVQVIDIQKAMVSQPILYATLSKIKIESDYPPLICYYGHGKPDLLVGDEIPFNIPIIGSNFALLKEGHNDSWLRNTILYTYACLCGRSLGLSVINQGALAFFGNTSYTFVGFPEIENDYSKDFAVIANTIPKALVNGYSLYEAMLLFNKTCDYYAAQYRSKSSWDNADYYEFAVRSMKKNYKLYTKKDIKWSGV